MHSHHWRRRPGGRPRRRRLGRLAVVGGLVAGALGAFGVSAGPAGAAPSTWTVTPSPNVPAVGNDLVGVSCPSPRSCVAVGYEGDPTQPLIESWNGTTWSIAHSPHLGQAGGELAGVSCFGPDGCVAVGSRGGQAPEPLVESWDGATWSVVPVPEPTAPATARLSAVSCVGPSSCVAVGTGPPAGTLVESWNGSAWSVVATPSSGPSDLDAVSCTSADSCAAVGYGDGGIESLVEVWNGTAWTIAGSPSPNPQSDILTGVSCVDPGTCTAVGTEGGRGVVDTGNTSGTAWTAEPTPPAGVDGSILTGVSCSGPASCAAVGRYQDGPGDRTLIESWDGRSWSVTASPDPGTSSSLQGVSCPGPGFCVAVSFSYLDSPDQTLVETGTIGPLTVVSTALPDATVGQPYSFTLQASGGTPPYLWVSAPGRRWLDGLTLDPRTGVLSGTPAEPGSFTVTVAVVDAHQPPHVALAQLSLTVT